MKDKRIIIYGILAVALFCSPFFLNRYWVDVLNSVGMYAILGLSLNLIVGHAGLFNLGHAAFYAVGAYTAAILNTTFHIPILWLLPVCGLTAGLFAVVIARPIIHLRGDYLCIVTIGIGEIVRIALINDVFGITGGVLSSTSSRSLMQPSRERMRGFCQRYFSRFQSASDTPFGNATGWSPTWIICCGLFIVPRFRFRPQERR